MPQANKGEVWLIDFGLAAKVRPAVAFQETFGLSYIKKNNLQTTGHCLGTILRH